MKSIKLKLLILCFALCSCKKKLDDSEAKGKTFKLMCIINNDPEIPFTFNDCLENTHEIIQGRTSNGIQSITFIYNKEVIRQLNVINCEQLTEFCSGECSHHFSCSDSRGNSFIKIVNYQNGLTDKWHGSDYFNILDYPFPGSNWYVEQQ